MSEYIKFVGADELFVAVQHLLHEGCAAAWVTGKHGQTVRRVVLRRGLPSLVAGLVEPGKELGVAIERLLVLLAMGGRVGCNELLGR